MQRAGLGFSAGVGQFLVNGLFEVAFEGAKKTKDLRGLGFAQDILHDVLLVLGKDVICHKDCHESPHANVFEIAVVHAAQNIAGSSMEIAIDLAIDSIESRPINLSAFEEYLEDTLESEQGPNSNRDDRMGRKDGIWQALVVGEVTKLFENTCQIRLKVGFGVRLPNLEK